MEKLSSKIIIAILAGLLLNTPFAIGEFVHFNPTDPRSGFPLPLFIAMWVEVGVFTYLLLSVVETLRRGFRHAKPILFGLQILILTIFAWAWVTLIIDQWPCFFLGGNGC